MANINFGNNPAQVIIDEETMASHQYLRDFYRKDYNYIAPDILKTKNIDTLKDRGARSLRLFAKLWFQELVKGLKQFLYEGSLHGVKYILEPSFNHKERVTWIVIMVLSLSICAMNIFQLVSKWTSTPFVNVIDSLPTPIWAVPFPSVVLCPHLHVKLSFYNVSKLNNLDRFFASLVCPHMAGEGIFLSHRLNSSENMLLQDFVIKGSPNCSNMVKMCYWRTGLETEWFTKDCCEKLLKPVYTDYGLCYTFNGLPLSGLSNNTIAWQQTFYKQAHPSTLEWDLDNGYPILFPPKPNLRPFRVMASGEANGFGVDLFLNISEHQYACDGNHIGFNVLINSPADHVYISRVLRIPMDRMTTVEVSPITYKTDISLRSLSPDQRQCFFQNERKLQYFEYYTDANCRTDLWIRETSKNCTCILFNWPRQEVQSPVCSTQSDFKCVALVKAKIEEQLMNAFYADSEEHRVHQEEPTSCYPACNDVLYSTQVYYSDLFKEPRYSKFDGRPKKGELTSINVHFHEDIFLGQHRHAQYDEYYFAGAIGGLLSLFLGFSIISVAEIVYFVMLRPILTALRAILYRTHLNYPNN